jgi:phage repressor protein C with HTH and peptisase S24 domain
MTYLKDNLLFLRKKKQVTQGELAEELALGRTTITNYESGLSEPNFEILTKIVKYFDVSMEDILNIDMQLDKKGSSVAKNLILNKKKVDDLVPVTGSIPLIPIEAFAGISNNTDYSIDFNKIEERYIIPLFNEAADFLISVRGVSMLPKYNNGDIVACKFINDRLYIQWNRIYVIDTFTQGVMIKRILPSDKTDHYLLRSDNKEYPDFLIPQTDIRNIALVLGGIILE